MKDFLKTVLAVIVGLFVASGFFVLLFFFFIGVLIGIAGSASKPVASVPDGSVLVVDLNLNVTEPPPSGSDLAFLMEIFGTAGPTNLHLRSLVDTLQHAASDDRIEKVFLHGSFGATTTGLTQLRDVRKALQAIKSAGKPIHAYLEVVTARELYLASMADKITVHPGGVMFIPGFGAEALFLGGLFEKYGVGFDVVEYGEYKNAFETITERSFSPESREQLQPVIDQLWQYFVSAVETGRSLPTGSVGEAIERYGILEAGKLLELGLIDELNDLGSIIVDFRNSVGRDLSGDTFRQVSLATYAEAVTASASQPRGRKVAVLYTDGLITNGRSSSGVAGGATIARQIRELQRDNSVAAVVLRVNSPGGSSIGSDMILQELRRLQETKPVVVSMGGIAASGGYWVSAQANRIFADETTITGSIGVAWFMPNVQGLADRFGISFDTIASTSNVGLLSIGRPRTEAEMAKIRRWVRQGYDDFTNIVSSGRNMSPEQVDAVARGRIFTGKDAQKAGLVDELGGLHAAIAHAAELADLGETFAVVDFPPPREFLEELLELLQERVNPLASAGPWGRLAGRLESEWRILRSLDDPTGRYAFMPYRLRME